MKKRVFLWLIPIVVVGVVIGAVVSNKSKTKYNEVKTATVKKGNLKAYLSTNGQVKSKNIKEYFGAQGKVKTVNAKIGQSVKSGDVLVVYDTPDLNSAVKQAELQYNNSILQRNDLIAQRESMRNKISNLDSEIKKLENRSSNQDITKLQSLKQQKESLPDISDEKIKQAENGVELGKIVLSNAIENLKNNKSKIVCENSGIITAINVKEGAADNGMQPAVVVQDIYNLESVISLNKYDASKIKIGQEAIIRSNNSEYKGKVSFLDPVAKEEASASGKEISLEARVDILGKPQELKIGFDADIDILVAEATNTLKVPAEAVKLDKKGNSFVYVVNVDKVEERKAKLGIQSDIEAEILQGLKVGERVILNPNTSIKNGVLVKETLGGTQK